MSLPHRSSLGTSTHPHREASNWQRKKLALLRFLVQSFLAQYSFHTISVPHLNHCFASNAQVWNFKQNTAHFPARINVSLILWEHWIFVHFDRLEVSLRKKIIYFCTCSFRPSWLTEYRPDDMSSGLESYSLEGNNIKWCKVPQSCRFYCWCAHRWSQVRGGGIIVIACLKKFSTIPLLVEPNRNGLAIRYNSQFSEHLISQCSLVFWLSREREMRGVRKFFELPYQSISLKFRSATGHLKSAVSDWVTCKYANSFFYPLICLYTMSPILTNFSLIKEHEKCHKRTSIISLMPCATVGRAESKYRKVRFEI